jgi:hypothetical protein
MRMAQKVSKYHVVLNPDIFYQEGVVEELIDYMEKNKSVGLCMPKILYPDGDVQYLCKLLPTPRDLFVRKYLVALNGFSKRNARYELKFTDYNTILDVPFLSGCFMALRTEVFDTVGLFDERFFMYGEDIDFSRRIHEKYRTVYYPRVHVYHDHRKESFSNRRMGLIHMVSIIKYFFKWGWIFDRKRKRINERTLRKIEEKGFFPN